MARTVKIDRARKTVYVSLHGIVTEAEILETMNEISASPDFDPAYSQIADFSHVDSLEVTPDFVNKIAIGKSPFAPTAQRIIIAPDDRTYAFGLMYQTLATKTGTRTNLIVVRSRQDAYQALGILD